MVLIDAHNLMGRTPGLSLADEERSRAVLAERLAAWASGRREAVVAVFDGNRAGGVHAERVGALEVVYTPAGRTADDEILRRLERGNPRTMTVVTSDRGLARAARARGARVLGCGELLERMDRRARGRSGPEPAPPPDDVEYWLRKFRAEGR